MLGRIGQAIPKLLEKHLDYFLGALSFDQALPMKDPPNCLKPNRIIFLELYLLTKR